MNGDRTLAPVRRLVEDLPVEGHRRGAARVERHRGLCAEIDHEARQL